jgi:helicase SWR1
MLLFLLTRCLQYKSRYDLLGQRDADAGPSRRTRRAQNELSESLKHSVSSPTKQKTKKRTSDIWTLLAETKGKEKPINAPAKVKEPVSISTDKKGKGRALPAETLAVLPKIKLKRPLPETASAAVSQKKCKLAHETSTVPEGPAKSIQPFGGGGSTIRISRTRAIRQDPADEAAESPKLSLRKIKLIVRTPPLALSNPDQKPPPPLYGGSIPDFLSSFTALYDGKDVQISKLEALAKSKAAIYNKRDLFVQRGRFIPGFDPEYSAQPADGSVSRHGDVWDAILESIASRDNSRDLEERRLIISKITETIKAYWEAQAVKQGKLRVLEEKRLRGLAKEAVKLVLNEWKRALLVGWPPVCFSVFHIDDITADSRAREFGVGGRVKKERPPASRCNPGPVGACPRDPADRSQQTRGTVCSDIQEPFGEFGLTRNCVCRKR